MILFDELPKCIVVKNKQYQHQLLLTGNGDERHCHFCQLTVPYTPLRFSEWEKWKYNLKMLKFKTVFNIFKRRK